MKKLLLPILIVLLSTAVVHTQTVVDIIVSSPVHEILEDAVIAAELDDDLSNPGPFTVFAPTDDAFDALPPGVLDTLLSDPFGELTDILLYHTVSGSAPSSSLSNGQLIETLIGKNVEVSITMNGIFINNALVTVADIPASNGIVHVIDAVLLPPEITVVDIISNSPVHETLETAIIEADLVNALNAEGPFTVFAPTDDAFDALPAGLLDSLIADTSGFLADILLYHTAGVEALSGTLTDNQVVRMLNGNEVLISIDTNGVMVNNALVTVTDLQADNGVVHVIDAVLVPPLTVMDIIEDSPIHETLETALEEVELDQALNGIGPFTIFAPTDDAFDALPAGLLDSLLADTTGLLTDILLYHVTGDRLISDSLFDGQMIMTLNGKNAEIRIDSTGVFINDAQITLVDVVTDNGILHVIDAVIVPPRISVVDIIVNSPDHEILETAVIAAELADDLDGEGPFTVFAPTDDAFSALPPGLIDTLLQDPTGMLADILLYHAVGDYVLSDSLVDGQVIATLQGKGISVSIDSSGVKINDANVTVADIETDNGVVHVIDAVLIPPRTTVVDVIVNSPDHEILETAVIAAELADDLDGEGPFTVFAPTDDAFSALPPGLIDTLLQDPTGLLADILLYHVVGAEVLSDSLENGQTAQTLLGENIYISVNDNGVFINDARVTVADIAADNGIVHVVDAVLNPPTGSIVDIVVNSPDHTILEAGVVAAGLADALNAEGPLTVFAPTDAAFEALPDGLLDTLLQDPMGALTDVLLYHVTEGASASNSLSDGQTIMTLNGKDIEVRIDSSGVYINDALVILADLYATNGIVHVIDAVLIPPRITVADIIIESPIHETLEAAVVAADLVDVLNGDGPFTVFAPTDDAFEALPTGLLDTLLQDPMGALTDILLYHAVGTEAQSGSLSNGQTVMTINGEDVYVSVNDNGIYINNALVTVADIITDNGVVHVIDAVLIPPTSTIVDIVVNSPDHTILEAGVVAAGLVDALNADGPLTVFAPTDQAFENLPNGLLDSLLQDPMGLLTDILLYHVVDGAAPSQSLTDGQRIMTLNGQDIVITFDSTGVLVNDARVTVADIYATNGIVHVIDAVLVPATESIVDIIVNSPDHNILEAAVVAADLVDALNADGPFTVFAPTDAAFSALPDGLLDTLLMDPMGELTSILLYHVVEASAPSGSLSDGQLIMTMNGEEVLVSIDSSGIYINDALVTVADIQATNGIVHVIDAVLVPGFVNVQDYSRVDNAFTMYPNPARDIVNVDVTISDGDHMEFECELYDLRGQILNRWKLQSNNFELDVSTLPPGQYLIKLTDGKTFYSVRTLARF